MPEPIVGAASLPLVPLIRLLEMDSGFSVLIAWTRSPVDRAGTVAACDAVAGHLRHPLGGGARTCRSIAPICHAYRLLLTRLIARSRSPPPLVVFPVVIT